MKGNRGVFTFILTVFTMSIVVGQSSISSSSFPKAGDTIYYKSNNFPEKRVLTAIGRDVVWDYSDLRSPFLTVVNFQKNNDIVAGVGGGTAMYEDGELQCIFNNKMKIVAGKSELMQGKMKAFHEYETLIPTKIKYQDELFYTSESDEIFNQKEIPSSLKRKLHKILLPLKIRTTTITRGEVAAAGTLILPWGAEQVLLTKMDISKSLECTYKDGDEWVSLNEEQKEFLDLEYKSSQTKFIFYSEETNLPLMTMDWSPNGGPERISYQVKEVGRNDIKRSAGTQEIVAFPNPTFGETKFEFLNYDAGSYTVEIYAVYGAKLWSKTYDLRENDIISENFSFLRKGTYLYTIKDSRGTKLITKRLVIISP